MAEQEAKPIQDKFELWRRCNTLILANNPNRPTEPVAIGAEAIALQSKYGTLNGTHRFLTYLEYLKSVSQEMKRGFEEKLGGIKATR